MRTIITFFGIMNLSTVGASWLRRNCTERLVLNVNHTYKSCVCDVYLPRYGVPILLKYSIRLYSTELVYYVCSTQYFTFHLIPCHNCTVQVHRGGTRYRVFLGFTG